MIKENLFRDNYLIEGVKIIKRHHGRSYIIDDKEQYVVIARKSKSTVIAVKLKEEDKIQEFVEDYKLVIKEN